MNNYFRKCGKMSEILQKTFNVLVGSGEGVGWGSPTSSNPHSLSGSLAATLRQLALAPLKEEKELCRVQVRFSHLSFTIRTERLFFFKRSDVYVRIPFFSKQL